MSWTLRMGTRAWKGATISLASGSGESTFETTIPDTNDWYLHLTGPIKSVTQKIDRANLEGISLKGEAVADTPPQYELKASAETSTGFWRGAASNSEKTFVAFPGQENWNAAQAKTLKEGAKIYKHS